MKAIDPLLPSDRKNLSIDDLVSNLFVVHWSNKINYSLYFDRCAPSFCTYSTRGSTSFSNTITLFFSLYGGLTAILRLLSPFFIHVIFNLATYSVKSIAKCGRTKAIRYHQAILLLFSEPCLQSRVHAVQWISRLNFFKLAAKRTANDIKRQRIITRCYIICFACMIPILSHRLPMIDETISIFTSGSIVILIAFTTLDTQPTKVIVSNPSLSEYRALQDLRLQTLECACSNSTMPYGDFVSISSTFHQICSSGFVRDSLLPLLISEYNVYGNRKAWIYKSKDYFLLLSIFCELTNKTTNYQLNNFLSQTFVTTYVLDENDFNDQLNMTTNRSIESIVTSFRLFVDTTRLLLQADQPLIVSADPNVILNAEFNIYGETSQSSTPVRCFFTAESSALLL